MNLLSPDDDVLRSGTRRKSVCNGAFVTPGNDSVLTKKKEKTRRGSLGAPPARRSSLVHRYQKIIESHNFFLILNVNQLNQSNKLITFFFQMVQTHIRCR